ncbi:MAG TPA: cytochrome c oxidase subunit II [Acidobacteriaceae bacterium]|nr:cytochrome c oxidase subunit II [Acidobacteriaceae bacterium]
MLVFATAQAALGQPVQRIVDQTPTIFDPHSTPGNLIYSLSMFVLEITGAIFLVVGGLWLYVVVRFRQHPSDDTSEPPQVYGSTQIELAWTVIPILLIVVLFLTTARILFAIQDAPMPRGTLNVDAVGHQYWWEFRYPEYGFVTANELHIPVSSSKAPNTTHLNLLSADVTHSFWVPALFGKIDLVPNKENSMWFDPDRTGVYVGQCAQFCGTAHAKMLLRVYVETPEDFAAWVKSEQQSAVQDPAVVAGRQVFESQSCVSCHTIRGTAAKGVFGPDLTHMMSRDTIASGAALNTPAELKSWIRDPQIAKPGCLMPAMQLSEPQIDQLVAYLTTLK